jgi:predicted phosphodiesterase
LVQRTLILSDTHFGRARFAATSPEALRPLWQGCNHLVVNGDVAEIHHPDHWSIAAQQTLRLFDLCEADKVTLTLLSGNHDPFITQTRHLLLANEAVFVTHGDVMHPAVAPWSMRAERMRERRAAVLAALPPESRESLEAHLRASQEASRADWDNLEEQARHSTVPDMLLRPMKILQVLWYWRQFPFLAARFMRHHVPAARFAVLGHTHHPGIWNVDGRTIINTGSFGFPGHPRAVIIENDQVLSVRRIRRSGDTYELASEVARFDLPILVQEADQSIPA